MEDLEVFEYDLDILDYKIDSDTLDVYLQVNNQVIIRETPKIKIEKIEGGSNTLVCTKDVGKSLGEQVIKIENGTLGVEGNVCDIAQNTDYKLTIEDSTSENKFLQIHTPKQQIIDDKVYSVIGDDVNQNTYVSSSVDYVDTAISTPNSEGDIYGVYELESIGYDETNSLEGAYMMSNWGTNDLTLLKYDHIIRPLDGNYILGNDIDGSPTINNIEEDLLGGFGTNGMIPIGSETISGQLGFEGIIDGNSKVIDNLYADYMIYQTTPSAVIKNFGMTNPKVVMATMVNSNYGLITGSYASGSINVPEDFGGLVYINHGTISGSYTDLDITSSSGSVGGITYVNERLIINSYTTGDISGTSIVGGLVAENNESYGVKNSYATGNISGTKSVGGLIGENNDSYGIKNSYTTGNVTGEIYVGAITGRGYSTKGSGYETQVITDNSGSSIVNNSNLNGDSRGGGKIATYEDLINSDFYSLKDWESSALENEEGYDWTSPWTYGTGSDSGLICQPHVYNKDSLDVGDGTYVPNQPCIPIEQNDNISIDNYKINAMTMAIDLRINTYQEKTVNPQVKLEKVSAIRNVEVCTVDPGNEVGYQTIVLDEVAGCNIDHDKDYKLSMVNSDGVEYEWIQIHTPKQEVIDGKTYAQIGDGVNVDTYVDDNAPYLNMTLVDPSYKLDIYGIYELESIGYDQVNNKESSSSSSDWSINDLTFLKYDHIVRPLDGNYVLKKDIDASSTKLDQSTDKLGGFGSDGFRPIGQMSGTTSGTDGLKFSGQVDGEGSIISDLFIESPISNVGVFSKTTPASNIHNIGLNNVDVTGGTLSGGLIGYNDGDIDSVYVTGNVEGVNDTGGLVGYSSGEVLNNSYAMVDVVGVNGVGGLVGYNEAGIINNSYATGDIVGVNKVGGLVGSGFSIKNSYATGNVVASGNEAGGLIGSVDKIESSYAIGNVVGNL